MKPRLLIADGDGELRDVFRRFFSGTGFDVATAGVGRECLEQFRQFLPDVLVVEREMLWGSGDGMVDAVRAGNCQSC
jgi:CheY-like chemotaxis protein